MPPFFPASSSSSSANTTRPSRLHARSRRRRKRDGHATPSRFSPRKIQRHLFRHNLRSDNDGEGQADGGAEPGHNRTPSGPLKGALKRKGGPGHRKSVTIEEPHENEKGGANSDTGTVRIAKKNGDVGSGDEADGDTWITVGSHSGEHYGRYLDVPSAQTHHAEQNVPKLVVPEAAGDHPRRVRTRTVSRDDYLTARGANPRTGVVSPSITSSSNRTSTDNERHRSSPKGQSTRAKWRTKGNEWVSVDAGEETPTPPEITETQGPRKRALTAEERAQDYINLLDNAMISTSKLEDRFVVDMPSARDPEPPTMTNEQIIDFQRAVARLRRHGGQMVDPNVPPTPRVETPQGPSTPPRRLSKKFPTHFLGREPRWQNDPLVNDYATSPKLEAKDDEHVHSERTPATRDPSRMEQKLQQAPVHTERQPFLGQPEAREKKRSPLFQSLNALLFHSPPSTKGTQTSETNDREEAQEAPPDTTTQDTIKDENHPNLPLGEESLLQRRSATNIQKLGLDVPLRVPILEQFKRVDANTTITTTSTMLRRKPVPQHRPDPDDIDIPGKELKGPVYTSPYSFHYLPTSQDIRPRIEHVGDDVLNTRAGNRGHARGSHPQGGSYQRLAHGDAGCAQEPRRPTSKMAQWKGGAQLQTQGTPGRTVSRSSRPIRSHTQNGTPSRESSVHIREDQPAPLSFATRLHVVIVAAVLLFLDVVTYLCDIFRAVLRLRSSNASNETVEQADRHAETKRPEEDVPPPAVSEGTTWTSALLDVLAAIAFVMLVEKIIECVNDLGSWALLAVAMGT